MIMRENLELHIKPKPAVLNIHEPRVYMCHCVSPRTEKRIKSKSHKVNHYISGVFFSSNVMLVLGVLELGEAIREITDPPYSSCDPFRHVTVEKSQV